MESKSMLRKNDDRRKLKELEVIGGKRKREKGRLSAQKPN